MKTIKKVIRKDSIKLFIILTSMAFNMIVASGGDASDVMRTYGVEVNGHTTVIEESVLYQNELPFNVVPVETVQPFNNRSVNLTATQQVIDFMEEVAEHERQVEAERQYQEMLEKQRLAREAEEARKAEEQRKIEEAKRKKADYISNINNPKYINQSSNLSLEHMAAILKHTGLAGTEYAFYKLDRSGVNFFFAVSVSIQEAGWQSKSKRARERNDVFGITSVNRYYKSKQECIYYFGDFIQRLYINQGLTTVESINPKYCPSTNEWGPGVRSHMKKLYSIAMDMIP